MVFDRTLIPRILVISDTPDSLPARTLASLGYRVVAMDGFDEGLDSFEANTFSLVVVETEQSFAAIQSLVKELQVRQADVACVVIAKLEETETTDDCGPEGVWRWLNPPVNTYELIETVESVLCRDSLTFHRQVGIGDGDGAEHADIAKSDRPAWCEVCGYSTYWYHKALLRHFCSDSCLVQYQRQEKG